LGYILFTLRESVLEPRPVEPLLHQPFFLLRASSLVRSFCCSFREGEFIKHPAITLDRMMTGPTAANADPAVRLSELGAILAAGLQRLIARQSSELSADVGESSLHFTPDQSGHSNSVSPEIET
jgi:hypothetical protein